VTWRRRSKRARRWLVFSLARALSLPLLLLPVPLALALGRGIGRLAFLVAGRLRRRASTQLEAALGLGVDESHRLAREVFCQAGMVGAELVLLPRLRSQLADYVELAEPERAVLHAALAEGRGLLFVSAHLGSWELLAQRIALEVQPAASLARKAPNPFLGAWLERTRALGGLATINRGDPGAARRMLATLRGNGVLGVLIDQDTRVDSVHVPFFGRLAATPTAAAELALRRELPVVVGFIERRAQGHRVRLERLELGSAASAPDPVAALTALLSQRIEDAIRARPEAWVWFHARWATPAPRDPVEAGRASP
jgi:KDO2-lipid IV(A) lauroyltransferase